MRAFIAAIAAAVLVASCAGSSTAPTPVDETITTAPSTTVPEPAPPTSLPEPTESPGTSIPAGASLWTVSSVTDGDTITVVRGPTEERLRLIGMNANETGECMADEATRALEALVLGREISLVVDQSDRDRYGRLLRYVWVDGVFVNAALVESGLAFAREYPPDIAMADALATAEAAARNAELGLWAPDACGPATDADVRIVHVEADAPGNDNENLNGEWIDIENTGTEAVDLTGWGVKDESASHRYSFPDGFGLAGGAAVRPFTGCGTDIADEIYWCEAGSAVWNNSGDTAFLLDPSGNTVHHWSY